MVCKYAVGTLNAEERLAEMKQRELDAAEMCTFRTGLEVTMSIRL